MLQRATSPAGNALALLLPLLCSLTACAAEGPSTRLRGGEDSLDALGSAVWTALVSADTAALRRLRVSEREHNEHVWPELPAAAPPNSFPVDYAWQNIRTRNAAAEADLLRAFEASAGRVLATRCDGDTERHATFRILRDCWLVLAAEDGSERRVQAFRYVVQMDGRHKVVRYYGRE